ncbi:SIR2 family protein [uncultured Pontibacter sp.]|uniref:SIR2 family protein n=1 Tax=uncultured Pontibacter sp. TaxID=453356 RepID=UPI00260A838B|nr:SIR2 family protein [uncultured Pontibacter sp.]
MKIAFIIGNGFNYLIESIIRNTDELELPARLHSSKDELSDRIKSISSLWKKFDLLFHELKKGYPSVNEEELIRMIYAVLDFFSSIEAFEKVIGKEEIERIKHTFNFLLIDKIKEIAEEFRQHETSEGYKDLKRIFPYFGDSFKNLLDKNSITSCDIFTTNYDGIFDTLLTKSSQRGFLGADGFGRTYDVPGYFKLYEDNLKSDLRVLHIHGSYRFEKKFGNTYKTPKDAINGDPVIIFNNPYQKEELINRNPVLNRYFLALQEALESADKLIILGNSMKNEPHLKKIIKNKFNAENKSIYVCSRTPSEVKKEINQQLNYEVFERTTKHITSINGLINLIDEIIQHSPSSKIK